MNSFCNGQLTSIPSLTGSDVAVVISSLDYNIDQKNMPFSTEATPLLPIIKRTTNDKLQNLLHSLQEIVLPEYISVETRFITQAAAAHARIDVSPPDLLSGITGTTSKLPTSRKDRQLRSIRPCGPIKINAKPVRLMQKQTNTTNFTPTVTTKKLPFSATPKSKDDIIINKKKSPPPMVLLNSGATPNLINVTPEQFLVNNPTTMNYKSPTTLSCGNNNNMASVNNLMPLNNIFSTPTQAKPLKTFVDRGVTTDGPQPSRERSVQTDFKNVSSLEIGIQCSFDLENFEKCFEQLQNQNEVNNDENGKIKASFLKFVEENTYKYVDGQVECLICGEIKSDKLSMPNHMAQHWGPSALCCHCGIKFENEILFKHHHCEMKENKKFLNHVNNLSLKCPHYLCGVVAISKLELYDHINEHMDMPLYECSGCQRSFYTAGELRHHMTIRMKCLEALKQRLPYKNGLTTKDKLYRSRVFNIYSKDQKFTLAKSFLSHRAKSKEIYKRQRCQICLKICTNKFQFSSHKKRCLKSYIKRFERKKRTLTS